MQVVCIQPVAIVDHVAHVTEEQLNGILGDEEQHGSRRVDAATAQRILQQLGAYSWITSAMITSPGRTMADWTSCCSLAAVQA